MVKVKELSIYELPSDDNRSSSLDVKIVNEKNEFEKTISAVRQVTCEFMNKFSEQKERTKQIYDTGVEHTRSTVDYIRLDTNILPKITFITLSGLGGLLIGYRRSKFRKFLYSTILVGASASICYPKESKEYTSNAYDWTKVNLKSFYNDYIMPTTKKDSINNSKKSTDSASSLSSKDQVVIYNKSSSKNDAPKIVGDKGQSNEDDKHMYTNRSK